MNRLNSQVIEQKLTYKCGKITVLESIDSTNTWLLKNGEHGDVCISETQTAGRGRRGNQWVSPAAGNIYFSLCYCFEEVTEHWSLLGLLVGIAVAESLHDVGLRNHGVKWPNDIFCDDKKLGGILLESSDQSGRVIIGIGLNVEMQNSSDETLVITQAILQSRSQATRQTTSQAETQLITQPWTSMRLVLKDKLPSRNTIIGIMMNRLQLRLSAFSNLNIEQFTNDWQIWDILLGKRVIIHQNGSETSGKVTGLDSNGRVGVLHENNEIQYYSSAEIKLVPEL